MPPLGIVKRHIPLNFTVQLDTIIRWLEVYLLVLYISPEPLNKDIVYCPSLPIHAQLDAALLLNKFSKSGAGKLATLISIQYAGLAVLRNGASQALLAPGGRHGVGERPAHDVAAIKVYNRNKVHMPASHGHVGDIHGPNLIGVCCLHAAQQVRVNRMAFPLMRAAGVGAWPSGVQIHQAV